MVLCAHIYAVHKYFRLSFVGFRFCGMLSLLILAHIILFAHANTQNTNKSPKEKLYRIKYFLLAS